MSNVTRLVLAAALAVLPAVAGADPGKGKGNHKHHGRASHPVVVADGLSRGGWDRGCPPGLAKKDNGCQPPGQAKKNGAVVVVPRPIDPVVLPSTGPVVLQPLPGPVVVRPEPRPRSPVLVTPAQVPVVVGQRYDDVRYVTDPRLYGLGPAGPGSRYGIIGNQLVRLDSGSNTVLALIRLVEAVLD